MAKKDFKTTSELFISSTPAADQSATPVNNEPAAAAIPEGYKLVREAKTERLQILLRPTTHAKLKALAAEQGISKNELINNLIDEYIKGVK